MALRFTQARLIGKTKDLSTLCHSTELFIARRLCHRAEWSRPIFSHILRFPSDSDTNWTQICSPLTFSPVITTCASRSFATSTFHQRSKKGGADKEAGKAKKRKMGAAFLGVGLLAYVTSGMYSGNRDAQFFTYILSHFLIPLGLFLIALSFV